MNKLSTGHDSTLGGYLEFCKVTFGEGSPAITYMKQQIAKQSADHEVLQTESQMAFVLATYHAQAPGNLVVGNAF